MTKGPDEDPPDSPIAEHPKASEWPHLVWHYCPYETFRKIAESRQLRLMEATWAKDQHELKYGEEMALKPLLRQFNWQEIQRRKVPFESSGNRRPHVSCFTACSDSAVHWQRYGGEGSGMAIGISLRDTGAIPNFPQRLFFRNQDQVKSDWGLFWYPMVYDPQGQRSHAKLAAKWLFSRYRGPDGTWDSEKKFWVDAFAMTMAFKDPNYADEQEYRLAFGHLEGCRGRSVLGASVSAEGERSYTPLMLGVGGKSILSAVRLGPTCVSTVEQVRQVLTEAEFATVRVFRARKRAAARAEA